MKRPDVPTLPVLILRKFITITPRWKNSNQERERERESSGEACYISQTSRHLVLDSRSTKKYNSAVKLHFNTWISPKLTMENAEILARWNTNLQLLLTFTDYASVNKRQAPTALRTHHVYSTFVSTSFQRGIHVVCLWGED